MKTEVICEACGKPFLKSPTEIRRTSFNFCSRHCSGRIFLGQRPQKRSERDRFEQFCMPEPNSGCYLWIGFAQKCTQNYSQARFNRSLACRVAWRFAYGEIPAGMCVLHHCDNPMCVRPEHLFLGTRRDNQRDMARKGRARGGVRLGEAHPLAVITAAQAIAIREATGTVGEISRDLGISRGVVRDVRKRITWRHV